MYYDQDEITIISVNEKYIDAKYHYLYDYNFEEKLTFWKYESNKYKLNFNR